MGSSVTTEISIIVTNSVLVDGLSIPSSCYPRGVWALVQAYGRTWVDSVQEEETAELKTEEVTEQMQKIA